MHATQGNLTLHERGCMFVDASVITAREPVVCMLHVTVCSCLLAALSWFLASGVAWIPRTSMLKVVFVFSDLESLFFHI